MAPTRKLPHEATEPGVPVNTTPMTPESGWGTTRTVQGGMAAPAHAAFAAAWRSPW
ncbi:hypothetical protein MKK88_27955 [Methylobacterium sp. E-005]|uniref:hypothetical protein n=1 Tax=Methylobacterium sp. E-005 TaxID=2836549 RepID=UPI001FB95409|nr:hypothetical protein [Methylobacterium sp. E-005]MCJ2089792.1 hypothetical protein [Methylobacterium sp. E-005]